MQHIATLRQSLVIASNKRREIAADMEALDSLVSGQAMTERETRLKWNLLTEYSKAILEETSIVHRISRAVKADIQLFRASR